MDLDRIQELLKLMESHKLEEVEIEDQDFRVRLKKETQGVLIGAPQGVSPVPAAGGAAPAAGAEDLRESPDHHIITSPIVGSFYLAPTPDAEPFAEIGDPVDPDTVICIVEAMKVMNEVKAEVSGTVEAILVETGKPVEYGQPLFRLAKT